MYFKAQLRKRFEDFQVDASIYGGKGELLTLLGPSGSGKTTILQLLAGILEPDYARILVDGKDISGLPPERRNMGMVFQEKLLFPHLDVFGNVAFGLRMRGMDLRHAEIALKAVGLERLRGRKIDSLSGGERQRVAIARAIAYKPSLLLLDEPLKELDAVVKERIKEELRRLQRKLKITTIYVTHDVEEAFYLSDKVYILQNGRIVQSGQPLRVFRRPANQFVRKYFSPYLLLKIDGREIIARKSSFMKKERF